MASPIKTLAMLFLTMFLSCSFLPSPAAAAAIANHPGSSPRNALPITHPTAAVDRAAASLTGPPCCFADSCLSWSLDGTGRVLRGTCYDKVDQRGHWGEVTSSLDLGRCIGNFDGVLAGASK